MSPSWTARRRRIELERAPDDLDVVAVRERGERGLEAALADGAPGANDVRPDVDGQVLLHGYGKSKIAAASWREASAAPRDLDRGFRCGVGLTMSLACEGQARRGRSRHPRAVGRVPHRSDRRGRTAEAQVNTETLRKRIKAVGYSVIVEEAITGDVGNTQGISVGAGLGGGWASDRHLVFGYARLDYSKYAGVTSVDKTFAHVRYDYEFEPWLWGEIFAQAQSDAFELLDVRNLVGIGPRARLAHAESFDARAAGAAAKVPVSTFDVYFGTAYMFERDKISAELGSTGSENQSVQIWHRWSNYVTLQWQIDPRAIVATTFYAQPVFDHFGNVRILSDTLFTFHVTKVFSAGIAASIRYDSEPPTGVLRGDGEIKNTLGVTF